METNVRTPLEVFSLPQHLVVPLFQRPYVWDRDNQWVPLWQDIRRLAELGLQRPDSTATHFLGAVVLQAMPGQVGSLQAWSVIDGQQRLTTLQLMFDATASVFESLGFEQLTARLEALTHNPRSYVQGDDALLKLRHSNRDRAAYDEVMLADPPTVYQALSHGSSLLASAHRYFCEEVTAWVADAGDEMVGVRANVLASVLAQSIQIVVIALKAEENSQEIFETLNARGTPLTAADLIKNFIFQRLEIEGVDTKRAYRELWPFDSKFWEKEVSAGRYPVSRGSLFLNQWLVSQVGEEVGPKNTFSRFKHYVEHETPHPMAELLAAVQEQARRYQAWTEKAADPQASLDRVELSVYRSQAAEIEALKPAILWLHSAEASYSPGTIDGVVARVESWLMRRALLRLSLGDSGRVVADLIKTHLNVPDDQLVSRVESYLARLNAVSTYWPGDEELRRVLSTDPAYRRFKRGRLRMFLEAVEDHYRGFAGSNGSKTGMRVLRQTFPIEHLMPQAWSTNWPVADLEAELDRNAHVHRLGNLTLITSSLNSSVSNAAWLGEKGKRSKLEQHDVLLINRRIRQNSEGGWSEQEINTRTSELLNALIATWPVPAGHAGIISSGTSSATLDTSIRELVASGHLAAGARLQARHGEWGQRYCEVMATGELRLDDGQVFGTPSGAAHHLRKGATNGWEFWALPDGRRLSHLRAAYQASMGNQQTL
ncbi:DUF262 domain-containing protein [Arthrobacter sp. HS15c]|uniref:GmrSD restriction endonuclease domain-containing protein n=1 Tax=Arthrobacter sp. HS15c TaxID=3230279 RepID=UPI003467DE91